MADRRRRRPVRRSQDYDEAVSEGESQLPRSLSVTQSVRNVRSDHACETPVTLLRLADST